MGRGDSITHIDSSSKSSTHPLPQCSILINSSNPNLTGPNSFPYFPKGGPVPHSLPNRHAHHIMGYVTQWGGMDVGSGMLFSSETIDGLVHQLGGLRLRAECSLVPTHQYAHAYINQQEQKQNSSGSEAANDDEKGIAKCPVGTAAMTSSGGDELQKHYDSIIHTTPPFYNYPPSISTELKEVLGIDVDILDEDEDDTHLWSKELLKSCYRQSFKLAFDNSTRNNYLSSTNDNLNGILYNTWMRLFSGLDKSTKKAINKRRRRRRVAVPLLGAGCRAFPKEISLEIAATEGASWLSDKSQSSDEEVIKDTSVDGTDAVVFGLLEKEDAHKLSDMIEKLY